MRTIAIIGDSKGIGLSLRQRLLDRGDKVIGVSRTGAQAEGNYTGLVFDAAAHPCDLSSLRIVWTGWCTVRGPST